MRILHVVPSYLPAWRYGGPIRSVDGLARAQAAAGDEVEVFTTDADGPGRLDVPTDRAVDRAGVAVRYFPVGAPRRLFHSRELGAALRERVREFDAVHLHSVFLWPTFAAARAAERARVRTFVSPRGMLVRELIAARGRLRKSVWIRLVERRTLTRASAIVVQSELERRELEALGLALAPVEVVPNGFDPREPEDDDEAAVPSELEALAGGGPYVLFLGRISWKKGIDRLIDAMAQLTRVPDARLVVAGNDDEGLRPGLEERARRAGLGARVRFTGEVRGAAKRLLLERASVFCLPSRSENFGLAALEAMAVGRPVVVTPQVGLASLPEAEGGLVVAGPEPAALAEALGALLGDRARAGRMGELARQLVRERFAWAPIAARMREIYLRP